MVNKIQLGEYLKEHCSGLLVESIRNRDIEKALGLIRNYLRKKGVYTVDKIVRLNMEGKHYFIVPVFNEDGQGAAVLWEQGDSSSISAVCFTKRFDEFLASINSPEATPFAFDVYAQMLGANTMKCVQLIADVLNGKVGMSVRDITDAISEYQMYENESGDYEVLTEALVEINEDLLADLEKKRRQLYNKIRLADKRGDDTSDLQRQFDAVKAQMAEARTKVVGGAKATITPEPELQKACTLLDDEERATPEERFEDMAAYIDMILMGRRPLALICGAPGVGKTYRISQQLKKAGKQFGDDLYVMKGKCTPTALYTTLFQYKANKQILFFDDCDSIFKDDDAINILKAAYDSSDERRVSWNVANPIPMPQEVAELCDPDEIVFDTVKQKYYYPKTFVYEGQGIIATNYRAGQIDTAVRNRALICDLDFTVEEVLGLIRDIVGKTMTKYPEDVKEQTLNFLKELGEAGADCELSVRSFCTCCDIFDSDAPEKAKMRRVKELMRLQFARGGKKY